MIMNIKRISTNVTQSLDGTHLNYQLNYMIFDEKLCFELHIYLEYT